MNDDFDTSPILPLARPQYVPTPEAFITALAWKEFNVTLTGESDKPQAIRYSQSSAGKSSKMEVRATKPTWNQPGSDADRLTAFVHELKGSGFNSLDSLALARSVLESVGGVRVEKSGVQPASPMTPSLALAQNIRGLQGVANPPDIAGILETMFAMGTQPALRRSNVSGLWKEAALIRLENDPLLRRIDSAFNMALLDAPRTDRTRTPSATASPPVPYLGSDTPYAWFAAAWTRLTSEQWVQALPARVWVDWATTVTRMAFGLGYLWESAWYGAIAREVLNESPIPDVAGQIRSRALVDWRPESNGISTRDVASALKWRVIRGVRIREALKEVEFELVAINEQIRLLQRNKDVVRDLTRAVQSNDSSGSGKNAWEAVRYALRTRETATDAADYYGLLTSRARYLLPSPGTEWMAVIASLSVNNPGESTEVAGVMKELRRLGLRPELGTLIRLLERSGLARGSADADQGVIVQSAF